MKMFRKKSVMAGIFVLLLPVIVSTQSFLLEDTPAETMKFGFRYLRPDFEGNDNLTLLSGVYDLSVSIPLGSKLNITADLPFASFGAKGNESESGIGNIYVGLQYRMKSTAEKSLSASLGVFLPTMSEEKSAVTLMGYFTNYYEFQKYFPKILTIYGNLAYHLSKPGGLLLGAEIGPFLSIPTEAGGDDPEFFVHYGLSAGYRIGDLALKAELAGVGILTADEIDFEDRFVNLLAFGVQWLRGSVRPGLFYQLYLKEEWNDSISGVIGIKVDIDLKK